MADKTDIKKKLAELKAKLTDLEKVKLPATLKKLGQAYQEGAAEWEVDPNLSLADDEVAVLTSLITDLKTEIARLERETTKKYKINLS